MRKNIRLVYVKATEYCHVSFHTEYVNGCQSKCFKNVLTKQVKCLIKLFSTLA